MKIALDFDDTYTADPMLWTAFITKCKTRGHTVTFVTYRPDNGDNTDIEHEADCLHIDIVYTSGKQKQHCHNADVWIDDSPETIVNYDMLCDMKHGCEINEDVN